MEPKINYYCRSPLFGRGVLGFWGYKNEKIKKPQFMSSKNFCLSSIS